MNKYLSHLSALRYWEVPYSWVALGCGSEEALRGMDRPEISFTRSGRRRNSSGSLQSHLIATTLPKGAVRNCGGVFVSSPELVFAELARRLDFENLVLLGLLLCGQAPGRDGRAITDARKIRTFTSKLDRVAYKDKALKAAGFLEDGAASAHEAILYMLLSLPPRYGGYGLGGLEFNAKLDIPKEYQPAAGRRYFVADLLWRNEKLVLEYDSKTHHDNAASWMRDAKKQAVLKAMGYAAESINTAQLYDRPALDISMRVIAAALGKRVRIRSVTFEERRERILALLPHTQSEN